MTSNTAVTDPKYRAFRRMALRNMGLVVRALEPPREVAFEQNLLTWQPPADTAGITHYRIRIEKDIGPPDFEVPSGQQAIQLFRGDTFAISSYNKGADLESRPVIVGGDYSLDSGNVGLGLAGSQGLTISNVSATLSTPTDFGLRFWVIAVTYMASIEGLTKVEIWAENPSGDPAEKMAEATYIAAGDHKAYFALDPPDANTTVRVYLVPVTSAMVYPLKTVAVYGSGASANDTVQITPVPTEDLGIEVCANVTSWDVTTPTDFYDANGVKGIRFRATFTKPSDARWGGVSIVVKKEAGRYVRFGPYYGSPTEYAEMSLPITVENWRIFGQSQDKFGKRNSIQESGDNITPYEDVNIGTTIGALDLGKALTTSISSALSVVANVLGVASQGIDVSLIKDFAVSKVKLQNAPIIDAARIEDLAVGTGHIQLLAIGTGLINNLAVTYAKIGDTEIYGAKIANLGVSSAKIDTLAVNKITGWGGYTIDVTSVLSFNGPGGIQFSGSAGISVISPGVISGAQIWASGFYIGGVAGQVIDQSETFVGDGGVNTSGAIKINSLQVVGARLPYFAAPSPAGGFSDFAEVLAAHNTLVGVVQNVVAAFYSHGLVATS